MPICRANHCRQVPRDALLACCRVRRPETVSCVELEWRSAIKKDLNLHIYYAKLYLSVNIIEQRFDWAPALDQGQPLTQSSSKRGCKFIIQ